MVECLHGDKVSGLTTGSVSFVDVIDKTIFARGLVFWTVDQTEVYSNAFMLSRGTSSVHLRHQVLEQARRIGFVKLRWILRFGDFLLIFLCLLINFVEACILRQEFTVEVELKVYILPVVLLN